MKTISKYYLPVSFAILFGEQTVARDMFNKIRKVYCTIIHTRFSGEFRYEVVVKSDKALLGEFYSMRDAVFFAESKGYILC